MTTWHSLLREAKDQFKGKMNAKSMQGNVIFMGDDVKSQLIQCLSNSGLFLPEITQISHSHGLFYTPCSIPFAHLHESESFVFEGSETTHRWGCWELAGNADSLIEIPEKENAIYVIVLNPCQPKTLIQQLSYWLNWLECNVTLKLQDIEKSKENQRFLLDASLPLGEHQLTHNLGLNLVVVCHSSDPLDPHYEEEDSLDFMQQVIRSICLQFGATLIFTLLDLTSIRLLATHFLLHSCQLQCKIQSILLPNVLDRRRVYVPAGWDSLNKIRAQRQNAQFEMQHQLNDWETYYQQTLFQRVAIKEKKVEKVSLVDEQVFLEQLARGGIATNANAVLPLAVSVPQTGNIATSSPAPTPMNESTTNESASQQTEALAHFFQSLLKKPATNNTPGSSSSRHASPTSQRRKL